MIAKKKKKFRMRVKTAPGTQSTYPQNEVVSPAAQKIATYT